MQSGVSLIVVAFPYPVRGWKKTRQLINRRVATIEPKCGLIRQDFLMTIEIIL